MDNLNSKTDVNVKNMEEEGLQRRKESQAQEKKKGTRDSSMKKMKEGNFMTN